MPPKKKIRIPEGQQTLFQLIRQPSNHCDCENQNDRGESDTQESPADRDSSQMEEQDTCTETQTESETTTSAAASTKSKVQSENVLQESEKTLQSESKIPSVKIKRVYHYKKTA